MLDSYFMTYTPKVEHPKAVPEFSACVTVPAQTASQCKAKILCDPVLHIRLYLEKLHASISWQ